MFKSGIAGLVLGSAFLSAVAFAQTPTIEGMVRGANGKPLRGADVRLEAKGAKSAPQMVKTDAAGRYRFSDVARGIYKVTILSGGAVQGFIDQVQGGSGAKRVDFDIRPAAAAGGTAPAKKAKHMVWVPESTGSHLGGHWMEVADEQNGSANADNVEKKSATAVSRNINYSAGIKPGG